MGGSYGRWLWEVVMWLWEMVMGGGYGRALWEGVMGGGYGRWLWQVVIAPFQMAVNPTKKWQEPTFLPTTFFFLPSQRKHTEK